MHLHLHLASAPPPCICTSTLHLNLHLASSPPLCICTSSATPFCTSTLYLHLHTAPPTCTSTLHLARTDGELEEFEVVGNLSSTKLTHIYAAQGCGESEGAAHCTLLRCTTSPTPLLAPLVPPLFLHLLTICTSATPSPPGNSTTLTCCWS